MNGNKKDALKDKYESQLPGSTVEIIDSSNTCSEKSVLVKVIVEKEDTSSEISALRDEFSGKYNKRFGEFLLCSNELEAFLNKLPEISQ